MHIESLPPLPREVMTELLEKASLRSAAPGEALIVEGQRGESMFVLVEGVVEVVRNNVVVDAMVAGAVFGEIALLAEVPRVATIIAAEDSLLVEVTREMLAALEAHHPQLQVLINGFFKKRLLANLLRSNDLFTVFDEDSLARLGAEFQIRSAERGDQLITQGDIGRGLWLLRRVRHAHRRRVSGAWRRRGLWGDRAARALPRDRHRPRRNRVSLALPRPRRLRARDTEEPRRGEAARCDGSRAAGADHQGARRNPTCAGVEQRCKPLPIHGSSCTLPAQVGTEIRAAKVGLQTRIRAERRLPDIPRIGRRIA